MIKNTKTEENTRRQSGGVEHKLRIMTTCLSKSKRVPSSVPWNRSSIEEAAEQNRQQWWLYSSSIRVINLLAWQVKPCWCLELWQGCTQKIIIIIIIMNIIIMNSLYWLIMEIDPKFPTQWYSNICYSYEKYRIENICIQIYIWSRWGAKKREI